MHLEEGRASNTKFVPRFIPLFYGHYAIEQLVTQINCGASTSCFDQLDHDSPILESCMLDSIIEHIYQIF